MKLELTNKFFNIPIDIVKADPNISTKLNNFTSKLKECSSNNKSMNDISSSGVNKLKLMSTSLEIGKLNLSFTKKLLWVCYRNSLDLKLLFEGYKKANSSCSVENIIELNRTVRKLRYFIMSKLENDVFDSLGNPFLISSRLDLTEFSDYNSFILRTEFEKKSNPS